jgi:hypothetical protein
VNEYTEWLFDQISQRYLRLIVSRNRGVIGVQFTTHLSVISHEIMKGQKGFAKWQRAYRVTEAIEAGKKGAK